MQIYLLFGIFVLSILTDVVVGLYSRFCFLMFGSHVGHCDMCRAFLPTVSSISFRAVAITRHRPHDATRWCLLMSLFMHTLRLGGRHSEGRQ